MSAVRFWCSSGGALRRSGGSGLWRKVLGGAGLAPLAEQSEVDIEAGIPLMAPSSAGSGSLDAGSGGSRPPSQQAPRQQRQQQQQQPQDQHREAPEPAKAPMAAGPPSTLAPAVSGANLKLRGAVPGGAVLAVRSRVPLVYCVPSTCCRVHLVVVDESRSSLPHTAARTCNCPASISTL